MSDTTSVAKEPCVPVGPVERSGNPTPRSAWDDVRWLARAVLAQARADLVFHLPIPWLASAHLQEPGFVRDYALRCIAYPEARSRFEARTRSLRQLPAALLLPAVCARGYDGLIYPAGDGILGHVFFQRRESAVHCFAAAVNEAHCGRGYSVVMMLDFVAYASRLPGVKCARVGTGRNNVTRQRNLAGSFAKTAG